MRLQKVAVEPGMNLHVGWQVQKCRGARNLEALEGTNEFGLEFGRDAVELQVLGGQPVVMVHLQLQVTPMFVCLVLLGGLGSL